MEEKNFTNNLTDLHQSRPAFNTKYIVDNLSKSMLYKQQSIQSKLCKTYSKLKYYVSFKNFHAPSLFLERPLSFFQRKYFCKAIFGILPINEEILRYSNPMVPADKRYCDICIKSLNFINSLNLSQQANIKPLENLEHCCFFCPEYSDIRAIWLGQLIIPDNFNNLPVEDKFNLVFNISDNVKPTAKFITSLINKRSLFKTKYKK